MTAPVASIATPVERAWQRYRAAVVEAIERPTEAAALRREAARKEWMELFLRARDAA